MDGHSKLARMTKMFTLAYPYSYVIRSPYVLRILLLIRNRVVVPPNHPWLSVERATFFNYVQKFYWRSTLLRESLGNYSVLAWESVGEHSTYDLSSTFVNPCTARGTLGRCSAFTTLTSCPSVALSSFTLELLAPAIYECHKNAWRTLIKRIYTWLTEPHLSTSEHV